MNIELPHALVPVADPVLDDADVFDVPQTVTAERVARGVRGADAASRMRVGPARDARQWPSHASVDSGSSVELTFTAAPR
ncbi:hypothetical protein EZ313_07805 [Ramlibacter henchirensis]|uniref:Uncharacterized protein n=1 Tax=Ramlibacter henchirensis TaxID=204072 RepID=A0A4Z0C834_9BURK|nr:hypothetical protein [Ramlibacter henchirensis]TFZ06528.1 hypothetical protein EZ313_07805 [Ramlibacter henchirensis]